MPEFELSATSQQGKKSKLRIQASSFESAIKKAENAGYRNVVKFYGEKLKTERIQANETKGQPTDENPPSVKAKNKKLSIVKPALLTIIALVACFVLATSDSPNAPQIPSNSPTTKATLGESYIEKTRTIKGTKIQTYIVNYSYEVDGKKYHSQEEISKTPTPVMDVQYDARNPRKSRIDRFALTDSMLLYSLSLVAFIAGIIWLIVAFVYNKVILRLMT